MKHLFYRSALLSCSLLLAAAANAADATTSTAERPNIILILADDMDYADLSITGSQKQQTPNIDSIGKNGVMFTQAYVSCPVCGPSRVGILTGRNQHRIGYLTNDGPDVPENFGLPSSEVIIPEMLDSAGYTSGMIGKWHLGFKPEMTPNAQGFDYFFGHLHAGSHYFPKDIKLGHILRNSEPVKTTKYLTTEFGDEAAKFIRDNKDSPYFLYVPFNAVHAPWEAPEETLEKFAHIEHELDRKVQAMQYEMEKAVGTILEAVRDTGTEENTLIVFTNDHGGIWGVPNPNGIFRDGKMSLYEGGIRVPLLMQWKGKIKPGQTYDKVVSLLDLVPTFLAAANTTTTVELDGVNLFPYIRGENQGTPHETLYWKFIDAPNENAIRKGDWKAVKPAPEMAWELYNIPDDPGESRNLASEKSDLLKKLVDEWQEWSKTTTPPMWMDKRIFARRKQRQEELRKKAENTTPSAKAKRPTRKGKNQ